VSQFAGICMVREPSLFRIPAASVIRSVMALSRNSSTFWLLDQARHPFHPVEIKKWKKIGDMGDRKILTLS